MDLKFLKENYTYLIKPSYGSDNVKSITVLIISDKAYKVRWNNDRNNHIEWILKSSLDNNYFFVEDITNIVITKPEDLKFDITYKDINVKWHPYFLEIENCKTCGGSGQVNTFDSTGHTKICPACNGSGKQSKRTDILFD